MRNVVLALAALAAAAMGACAAAQPAPAVSPPAASAVDVAAQRKAAMAALAPLAGTWVGPGWRILPDGQRIEYDQTVVVTSKIAGQALMIEGRSKRRGPDAPPPGAGSLAVVTWEPEGAGRYAFRSFTGGTLTDSDGQLLKPNVFQWVVRGAGPWLRFTVTFDAAKWSEIGERSIDAGKTWQTSYGVEMTRAP